MTLDGAGRVTAVMHDTIDLDGAVRFWSVVLGLEVVHRDDTYAYLGRLSDHGPRLAFQRVPERKAGKNRLHLDVRVADREAFEELVLSLGGAKLDEQRQPGWPVWSVMADPEGNEFCIYESPEEVA